MSKIGEDSTFSHGGVGGGGGTKLELGGKRGGGWVGTGQGTKRREDHMRAI